MKEKYQRVKAGADQGRDGNSEGERRRKKEEGGS
jgi:hypothetical protein